MAEANSNSFNSFITLTYNRDITEAENSKYLKNLFDKLRQSNKDLKFLWVMERTKNDRIHIHMLTSLEFKDCNSQGRKSEIHKKIEQDFEKLWSYKGKKLGWIDIRTIKETEDKRRVTKYLAKYINKSAEITEVEKHKHLWGYSRKTLNKSITEKYEAITNIEQLLKDFSKDYEITYTNTYQNYIDGVEVGKTNYFDLYRKNNNGDSEDGNIDN